MTHIRKILRTGDRLTPDSAAPLTSAARRQRDREWVARLRRGDERALADIFNAYYSDLARYAESIVRSRDTALDVVSDVFQALWVKREQLEPVGLWPYLLAATRNRAFDAEDYRRRQEAQTTHLAAAGWAPEMGSTGREAPDDELILREEARVAERNVARLEGAYAQLNPRNREVLELWARGVSYREIGRTLGIALKTVDAHLQEAKRSLRHILGADR